MIPVSGRRALRAASICGALVVFAGGCASGRRAGPPSSPGPSPRPAADASGDPDSAAKPPADGAPSAATPVRPTLDGPGGTVGGAGSGPLDTTFANAPPGAYARVGTKVLSADDVAREFFRTFRRESFAALNRMVVNEIVRQEAARSGMLVPEEWLVREREKAFIELGSQAMAAYGKGADVAKYLETEFKETPASWARRKESDLRDQWLRDRVVRLHGLLRERAEIQLIAVREEALAREIASKLDQGADFAALAATHSIHESAGSGGRLPPVARESLNPALADRAFSLAVGARSGVLSVEDPSGGRQYDILKVLRRWPARAGTYAELSAEIEASLQREPVSRFEFVAWQLAAFSLYNVAVDDSL